MLAWFPKALTSGCTIECKSLAEHGDMIRAYKVTYFMASVDPLEKNVEFAKATSVKLGERTVEKKEADFPILSDPTKATATAYGVLAPRRLCQSLDLLYRQGRQDPGDRQGRQQARRDLGRRHGREARRAGRRQEVAQTVSTATGAQT